MVNFRKINEQLEYLPYPLIRIDRIFSKLQDEKLFPILDLRSGYYNITVAKKYPAFTTEYFRYEFLHILYGIHIAPNYFSMIIKKPLKDCAFASQILMHNHLLKKRKENI